MTAPIHSKSPFLSGLKEKRGTRLTRWLPALGLLLGGTGCGVAPGEELLLAEQHAALEDENGLSTNGLSTNGLSTNGLSTNGLSTNGFNTWFEANPELNAQVMKYMVRCAVPEGESRTYTSPATLTTYSWSGLLGLAPGWASGLPASTLEQEIITACLAAHANKYGVNVAISILGQSALSQPIPYTQEELSSFSVQEGCFFGNLFTEGAVYVGNDGLSLNATESTARACALSSGPNAPSGECPPLVHIGSCQQSCVKDSGSPFYTTCTVNEHAYPTVTTRLSPQDIHRCGDGICQSTESCGTSTSADNCGLDCGFCK